MFQWGELAGGQKGKPGGQCKINHKSLLSFDESKPVPGEVEGGEGGEVVKAGGGQAEGDQGDHQDEEEDQYDVGDVHQYGIDIEFASW